MMVASPLLSISQAQVQKSVIVSQNNTTTTTSTVSTTVSNTITSGNCSAPGPSMLPIVMPLPPTPRPFGNVGTSFFGGMQSLATAALGLDPPRPNIPSTADESTSGANLEKPDEHTRSLERWPDNPEHGSPIPRPLGRQKRVSEPAVSVGGVSGGSATSGGQQPPWQIDLQKVNQPASSAATSTILTTPITHLPWQLDIHSQITKSTPPTSSSFNNHRDSEKYLTNGANGPTSSMVHHTPIMAPAVERLLPIGNNRSIPRNIPQSVKPEEFYGSPESPLSKMDIMTVGSPIELDSENNENNENNLSSDVTSTCSASQLEPPPQERLLPIGQPTSTTFRGGQGQEQINGLVERVKMALGLPSPTYDSSQQPIILPQPSQIAPRINHELGLGVGGYSRQDSSDKPSESSISPAHPRDDSNYPSRGVSPRRLIKQLALDSSPPQLNDFDDQHSPFYRSVHYDRKPPARPEDHLRIQQQQQQQQQRQRTRKVGLYNATHPSLNDFSRRPGSWFNTHQPLLDAATQAACHAEFDLKQSSFRIGDDCVYQRCSECGLVREEYSDEELGLCIIILGTFIHREPALAAPLLPEMLSVVATVALNATYPWQTETNIHLPGGASSVAHQFLRCVLHQLAPNGVFVQMFQIQIDDSTRMQFFRSVAQALLDFNELNPIAPLQLLLEGLNSKKSLPTEHLGVILHNMACYLDCLPLEVGLGPGSSTWSALLSQLEILFRRVVLLLNSVEDINPLIRIMVSVLKVPGIAGFRGMLDPFGKVVSFAIQNFVIKYHYLVDLCYLCNRAFTREREKLILSRMVVIELVQALKFKTSLPDSNFLMLINFILQDVGGALPLNILMEDQISLGHEGGPIFTTNASECMKQHLNDAVEFLADFHTISKVKSFCKGLTVGLNEDTLGGVLKSGIAQYLALEISRGSNRDNRTVSRYLPWLYNAPSILQQGPREFIDYVGHIRLLSWLLLGALTHTALHGTPSTHHTHPMSPCNPVPQEASCSIADHIQVILAGFAEQSKASVLHMSSLSHAFILCQLWTVYLEKTATNNSPNSDPHAVTMSILFDFWGKVTPCILTLVSQSKVLAEMVNLHFLSLLEALLESNSMVLGKLLPLWSPVLFAYHIQLPGHLQVRLQNCRNAPPWNIPPPNNASAKHHPPSTNLVLLKWLQRLQFKMGQIELQSSAATQFYSV